MVKFLTHQRVARLTPHNHALRIMHPTVAVDQVAFGFQNSQNLRGLFEASGAAQDRADNLAICAAGFGVDRTIVFGLPTGRQVRHLYAPVAPPNAKLAAGHHRGRYGRFDLDLMRNSALLGLCGLPDYAEMRPPADRRSSSRLVRIIWCVSAGRVGLLLIRRNAHV